MRRLIGWLALGLFAAGCAGPTSAGSGPVTGPAGGDNQPANTAEQLEEVNRSARDGLRNALNRCYTDEMERLKDKKLTGSVMVKILIGTNERVDQVIIGEHTINGKPFLDCVTQTVKNWEFPKLNSAEWFSYPYEFSPAY